MASASTRSPRRRAQKVKGDLIPCGSLPFTEAIQAALDGQLQVNHPLIDQFLRAPETVGALGILSHVAEHNRQSERLLFPPGEALPLLP